MQTSKSPRREAPEGAPEPETDESECVGEDTPKREIGGADGPEPTRYGDWEHNGRCTDF